MWLILQQDKADDFVIGVGESHSVKEFLIEAFSYAGLKWENYVKIDPRYFRPTEVDVLQADASKAGKMLDWQPQIKFHELVRIMVDADMELAGLKPIGEGVKLLDEKTGSWHRWFAPAPAV